MHLNLLNPHPLVQAIRAHPHICHTAPTRIPYLLALLNLLLLVASILRVSQLLSDLQRTCHWKDHQSNLGALPQPVHSVLNSAHTLAEINLF